MQTRRTTKCTVKAQRPLLKCLSKKKSEMASLGMALTAMPEFKTIETSLTEIETSLPEINTALPEIETSLPEIETALPEIGTSLPEIETDLKS